MKTTIKIAAVACALALSGVSTPSLGQNAASPSADPAVTYPAREGDDDGDGMGKWGLLGLAGLAGLLGLKRRDNDVRTDTTRRP